MNKRKIKKLGETIKRHAEKMWNLILQGKNNYWENTEKQLRNQLVRDTHMVVKYMKYMKEYYLYIGEIANGFINSYCSDFIDYCDEKNHKDFIEDYGYFIAHGGGMILSEQKENFWNVFGEACSCFYNGTPAVD